LNDATCASTANAENDETVWRTASDIYIFVDTTWLFAEIHSMIG